MTKRVYNPTSCWWRECAFPKVQCHECLGNPDENSIKIFDSIWAKNNYKVLRNLVRTNS